MYFSKRNHDIFYEHSYFGPLEVCSENGDAICKEDLELWPEPEKNWQRGHGAIELTDGVIEVGEGFFDIFNNLKTIIIHRSVTHIGVTDTLKELFAKNKVTVRGWYGTYAQQFAKENGLKFSQADIMVGWNDGASKYYHTKLTIQFDPRPGRAPKLIYDDFCPGISAGNNGGGTYTNTLPKDYFNDMTLAEFTRIFKDYAKDIEKNDDLKWFFEHKK